MAVTTERWDLEVLFPGGPTSDPWSAAMRECGESLDALAARVAQLPPIHDDMEGWRSLLVEVHDLKEYTGELHMLAYCYNSAHTHDEAGRGAVALSWDVVRKISALHVPLKSAIGRATEDDLAELASGPLASWHQAYLWIKKEQALALEPALEALLVEADRDGLNAWGRLYEQLTGALEATIEVDGESQTLGVAQLAGRRAHPDAQVRLQAFDAVNEAYTGIQDVCAAALTHIVGARQTRLDRVGADELASTLLDNRVDREVLEAMWEGASVLTPDLVRYLGLKSTMLGGEGKLSWVDLPATVGTSPASQNLSWAEAQELILDAFASFSPALADFSHGLLAEGGIEAENREGKRSGGYCCTFQRSRTSRIFMTFTGTVDNAITLAHELGHAWHSEVLFSEPPGRRSLTPGLAESASTFAESIVRDRILSSASDPEVRRFMLDQQLQAGAGFLMNIPTRLAFEQQLYGLRRSGPFTAPQLTELMLAIQREKYQDALGSYDPMFWATKLHFYLSGESFYNWSYTFGYLFSSAIYTRAKAEGPSFLPQVRELLLRTGWQDCRGIARDALGVDLGDPAFWTDAAMPLRACVEEFEGLS